MKKQKLKVVTAGHVTNDNYDGRILPGGSAFYCAQVYRQLGASVRLATSVGKDFDCLDAFEGLQVFLDEASETTNFINTYLDDGRRIQKCIERANNVTPGLLGVDKEDTDILHIAPVMGETDLQLWVRSVKAKFVAAGLQGFLRSIDSSGNVVNKEWNPGKEELKGVDMVFLSEEDLNGQVSLIERLRSDIKIVVLTKGRNGSVVYFEDKQINLGVYQTNEVDPTGAGDVYSAGFLYALASGNSLENSAIFGAAISSIIVEGKGGSTLNRLQESFERYSSMTKC
jgi:1D-myo-inositol 3-kinase